MVNHQPEGELQLFSMPSAQGWIRNDNVSNL